MTPSAQQLLDSVAEAILAVDPDTLTILAANAEIEHLLGYPPDALLGRPISDLEVGLQDIYIWEEIRVGARQDYRAVQGEYRHQTGQLIPVEKNIRYLQIAEQHCFVVSVHSIAANQKLTDEAAQIHSLLIATLESTVDGILVTDLIGHVQRFNHRLAQQIQLPQTSTEILQHLDKQLLEPEAFRLWIRQMQADPMLEGKIQCRLFDRRILEIASRPQCLWDRPIGRIYCFHDITALKRAEEELIKARDMAQAANQAKSEFLSHMSHELRTPLNAILGFSQVLEEEVTGPSATLVRHIGKAGRHLLDLINEVLDLASIESGKLRLDISQVDLAIIIQDCLALTQPLAALRSITLSSPPIERGRFMARADAHRLRQMVLNLLSNAIKYNRDRGRVDVSVVAGEDETWRIMINDTGIGMTQKEISTLFRPFSRAGDLRQQQAIEGTGIGLSFTLKLAQLMHGSVGVESEPGMGSRFSIELPCAGQLLAPTEAPVVLAKVPNLILYIEDDVLSQRLLATVVARKCPDMKLLIATTGAEGLTLAQRHHPALILLDQLLPDLPGSEVFAELQKNPETQTIPVYALSGEAGEDKIATAMASGYTGYITKPLQIDAVLDAISKSTFPPVSLPPLT